MITVIIPVLNESKTIGTLVEFVRLDPRVNEIIVVDDGSIDGTPELATSLGAKVITSTLLGKGASMEDGMKVAKNDILLYLDGDLSDLCENLISRMVDPIVNNTADFVKAKFSRTSGRVTTLTAKPLIRTFFPELAAYEQPLGGIIAARRSLLKKLPFETDYGVDLGLFIDAWFSGMRVIEVDIGHIEHDSQSLDELGDMAIQVVRTLLNHAGHYGRLKPTYVREVREVERRSTAELALLLDKVGNVERLALLDMDGTLLNGRFIVYLAERIQKRNELEQFLDNANLNADERARSIAGLFAGVPQKIFEETAREVPLMQGATKAVVGLRKFGYRVGIVTDSYRIAAEVVRRRVFADFTIAHLMKFRNEKATGKILLSPAMFHPQGCSKHRCCKQNVMLHLIEKMGIGPDRVLAIGDSENDLCMLQAAGQSVAFRPRTPQIAAAAKHVLHRSLADIFKLPNFIPIIDEAEINPLAVS